MQLFAVVAQTKKVTLAQPLLDFIREQLGVKSLTGSDLEAIVIRAKEAAVLAGRDAEVQLGDLELAVHSFIDPLDANLLRLQELAAILACSDRRYLPPRYRDLERAALAEEFAQLKRRS